MKITNDGFVWLIITSKVKEVFSSGLFEVYALFDDNSDTLVESHQDLEKFMENGCKFGIEVGYIESVKK